MTDNKTDKSKRLYIKTFGCQMNVYDSERMADVMGAEGYGLTEAPEDADLIVLNTCHIREKAAEKVYSELGRIRKIKQARADQGLETQIAVAGCVAQAEGEEMARRAPIVDLVVGPQIYHKMPHLLARRAESGKAVVETEFPDQDKFKALKAPLLKRAPTAFLTVQEGCDKFCTFCVVPYTRGVEYSRPVRDIYQEAERLVAAGVREITLLGQNVNAYHGLDEAGNSASLAELLNRLGEIDGLARLRYTTSHPNDMDEALLAAHGNNEKLMPYLHLPFQAGSDRILAAMNRKHTVESYMQVIADLRAARPDIALSTDIIVGFPGETAQDFEETMNLVREVSFAQAYSFKYSPRPGTPASTMDAQVPEDEKSERLQWLQALLREQQLAFNQSCAGQTMPVLLEKPGRKEGQIVGRSPYLQAVYMDMDAAEIGDMVDVEVISGGQNSLNAVIKSAHHPIMDKAYG